MTEFIIKQTELSKELGTQHFAHPNKMVKKKKKKYMDYIKNIWRLLLWTNVKK